MFMWDKNSEAWMKWGMTQSTNWVQEKSLPEDVQQRIAEELDVHIFDEHDSIRAHGMGVAL